MNKLSLSTILFALLLLFAPLSGFAQKIIEPESITPAFLKETFENAFIEVLEVEEDYIKIKDYHQFYIDIDPKKRFVTISVSYALAPDAKPENVLKFLNLVNKDVAMIKAYTNEDYSTVSYYYYFWTNGGFTQKSLVSSIGIIKAALDLCLEKDTFNVL